MPRLLNVSNIRLWIRALKSDEFKQTRHQLRIGKTPTEYTHCCLGVGCELYSQKVAGFFDDRNCFIADFKPERIETSPSGFERFKFEPVDDETELPPPVLKWFGLSQTAQDMLAEMNDGGATFQTIITILEKALKIQKQSGRAPSNQWWTNQKILIVNKS